MKTKGLPHKPSDEQIKQAAGTLRYAASRAAMLGLPDREIAAIILNHRGKRNPVSIEEIAGTFGMDAHGVKASVERIRTEARIPVAAHKGNPGGYCIPETAKECDECHDRMFREGIKLIRLSQLFKREGGLS